MEGFIHTDDHVKLRYSDHGTGRPVVFVHAWQTAADQCHAAARALVDTARVVSYDHRGHGRSDDAPSGWTVHRPARDFDQLLDALAISGAVLVGHSMGCSVI